MAQLELFYLAHSRTGDKGDSQTMSLLPYRAEDYALLERVVTGPQQFASLRESCVVWSQEFNWDACAKKAFGAV